MKLNENHELWKRMRAIYSALMNNFDPSSKMSTASKGNEREVFVKNFLQHVLPPRLRLGTGDIFDSEENSSGQVDIVVESEHLPSLPKLGFPEAPRLYLVEGVSAVIEVKSNLADQWDEVKSKYDKIKQLKPKFQTWKKWGPPPDREPVQPHPPFDRLPFFAVGFTGWKTLEAFEKHCDEIPLRGALVIDQGFEVGYSGEYEPYAKPEHALWAFLLDLHTTLNLDNGWTASTFSYLD